MPQAEHLLVAEAPPRHTVSSTWREARAGELEAQAMSLGDLLDHLDDVEAMTEEDEQLVHGVRTLSALVRSRLSDLHSAALALRGR